MNRIESLKPVDTPDHMRGAWLSCVLWVAGQPEAVEEFERQTGVRWTPPRTALDKLIDQASGHEWAVVEAFVRWVNTEIWGPLAAPVILDDD